MDGYVGSTSYTSTQVPSVGWVGLGWLWWYEEVRLTDGDGGHSVGATAHLRRVALARPVARGGAQASDVGVLEATEALVPVLEQSPGPAQVLAVLRAYLLLLKCFVLRI